MEIETHSRVVCGCGDPAPFGISVPYIFGAEYTTRAIDLALLSNISPVSWKNVILYGDYILNRNKVTL